MSIQLPGTKPMSYAGEPVRSHRHFLAGVFAFVGFSVAAFAFTLGGLGRAGMLPPPPLAGSLCIDEKFKFLAEHDIQAADLLAVGSSVTWRNLDMTAFIRAKVARQPVNAAPCYLYVGQTAYLTGFLLDHLKGVRTVLTVVAPRDFERCAAPKEEFFSPALADAYVFEHLSSFPIYLTNFRPMGFVEDMMHIKRLRSDPTDEYTVAMDAFGSSPLRYVKEWWPAPALSESCFAALGELERVANTGGAQLIVASLPMHPGWRERYDPEGKIVEAFEMRARAALTSPSTLFVASREAADESWRYADSLHLMAASAAAFSDRLAALIAARQE